MFIKVSHFCNIMETRTIIIRIKLSDYKRIKKQIKPMYDESASHYFERVASSLEYMMEKLKMKCYLCNEEITYDQKDEYMSVGHEFAHIDCQERAELKAT